MSDFPNENSPADQFFRHLARSILMLAIEEMRRHKWIASEQAGRDLGYAAIEDWERRFWWRFCRHRRFEHILGDICWREFDELDFALLKNVNAFRDLLDQIVDRMRDDRVHVNDQLEVINWAKSNPDVSPKEQQVLEFLLLININAARLHLPDEWKRLAAA